MRRLFILLNHWIEWSKIPGYVEIRLAAFSVNGIRLGLACRRRCYIPQR